MRKIFRRHLPDSRAILPFVLILVMFCFISFYSLNRIAIRLLSYNDAQNMAIFVFSAKSADKLINSKLLHLQTLAHVLLGTKPLNEKLIGEKLETIGPAAAKLGYDQILFTNQNGLSVGLKKAGIDIAGSDHFYRAIQGSSFVSHAKGKIIFSVPVFSGADIIGVLTASITAGEAELLKEIKMSCGDADVFIIDDNLNTVDYSGLSRGENFPQTGSSGFLTTLDKLLDPLDLERIRETIPTISGEKTLRFKEAKEGRMLSMTGLPSFDGWRLVTVSSKDCAAERQKSLLLLGGLLTLFLSALLVFITISFCLVCRRYSRMRDIARRTIDKAGFYFFKLSGSGEVEEFEEDLALLLSINDRTISFSLCEFTDEGDKTFPADLNEKKELHLSLALSHSDLPRN